MAHKAETLATLLSTKRYYMRVGEEEPGAHHVAVYDPRFLLFEFTW